MAWIWDGGGENSGLTNFAFHDNIFMSGQTRGFLLPSRQRIKHHTYFVNIAPRRNTTDESPANWPDNRWQRSYAGRCLLPRQNKTALAGVGSTDQSLTSRKEVALSDG